MQWVTRRVMFLNFKTRADVEAFKDGVHGIVITSDIDHRDHLSDFRVNWAYQDMDTFDRKGDLHPKKPRYFEDIWRFLPRRIQGWAADNQ